ncbi:MAG: 2-C-methyl-D-erythritol 2,4-cyclodiphosphate synthase [Chlamydiales bacterium]
MKIRVGIGQDSHAFEENDSKLCRIGGLDIKESLPFAADSDGDIVLHAICNAISSLSHVPILGKVAISLCRTGITDSQIYVEKALGTLGSQIISHVALSIEGKTPRLQSRSEEIRRNIADILHIGIEQVGLTITSGDGLTAFGRGEGMQCLCIITTEEK